MLYGEHKIEHNAYLAEKYQVGRGKKSKRNPSGGQVEFSHLPSGWLQAYQVTSGTLLFTSVKEPVSLSTV